MHNAEVQLAGMDQLANAQLIQQRAQARAPKRTGTLGGSIYARNLGAGAAIAASDLVYAPVIHYGWARHNIAAQPFLETAMTDSVRIVEANADRDAEKILSRVKGA